METDWGGLRQRFSALLVEGWEIESERVLRAVAAHRDHWRPAQVRVLLLAESHVYTHEAELATTVSLAPWGQHEAPAEFVRLVYCLGYGESKLAPGRQSNGGTPQFWKLFASCVDDAGSAACLKGVEPNLQRRVDAKLALLERLKTRGVWLLDACPVALYRPGGTKPGLLQQALRIAWEQYAAETVARTAPRAVMVIGKMVYDTVGARLKEILGPGVEVDWMYQPQAHVTVAAHAEGRERLRAMVSRHGRPL